MSELELTADAEEAKPEGDTDETVWLPVPDQASAELECIWLLLVVSDARVFVRDRPCVAERIGDNVPSERDGDAVRVSFVTVQAIDRVVDSERCPGDELHVKDAVLLDNEDLATETDPVVDLLSVSDSLLVKLTSSDCEVTVALRRRRDAETLTVSLAPQVAHAITSHVIAAPRSFHIFVCSLSDVTFITTTTNGCSPSIGALFGCPLGKLQKETHEPVVSVGPVNTRGPG